MSGLLSFGVMGVCYCAQLYSFYLVSISLHVFELQFLNCCNRDEWWGETARPKLFIIWSFTEKIYWPLGWG